MGPRQSQPLGDGELLARPADPLGMRALIQAAKQQKP